MRRKSWAFLFLYTENWPENATKTRQIWKIFRKYNRVYRGKGLLTIFEVNSQKGRCGVQWWWKFLQGGIKRALPPWNTRWSALKFWLAEESQRWEHFGGVESTLINRLCTLNLHSWNRATSTLCGKLCIAILRWYVNWKIGRTVQKLHLYTICCHLYRFG